MKRKHEETSKYQSTISQLLTLFFSGVYITSHDMLVMAKELGHELPSKNRELILKHLFLACEKNQTLVALSQKLIALLQKRVVRYQQLSITYSNIQDVSALWIQKAQTMIKLLQQTARPNPYE